MQLRGSSDEENKHHETTVGDTGLDVEQVADWQLDSLKMKHATENLQMAFSRQKEGEQTGDPCHLSSRVSQSITSELTYACQSSAETLKEEEKKRQKQFGSFRVNGVLGA